MDRVTAPPTPVSRRAARASREEAHRRASAISPRRAAQAERLLSANDEDHSPARHARPRRLNRRRLAAVLVLAAALLLGVTAGVTALVSGAGGADSTAAAEAEVTVLPPTVKALPVPQVQQAPASTDICSDSEVTAALTAGDDEAAIAAAGGGEAFRNAVASGRAPCIDLADPVRIWAVINKIRPFAPIDYGPADLVMPEGVRSLEGGSLRADAASALTAMVTAASDAGVGEIALESGFRSYATQQGSYGRQVAARGTAGADLVSARPGFSEHQSGLAGDVVACAGGCGTLDDLALTPQGTWVRDHSWEHGWVVRYVDGATDVTGYLPEPWHLRYIGRELARAYHDGGWTSLEQFFGLPAAPGYLG